MTGRDWAQLKDWFAECTEGDGETEARILAEAERQSPELAAQLRRLLLDHRQQKLLTGALLGEPQSEEAASRERIGPYRVLRELGRGGTGIVFLAERSDDEYHRQVAIKLLRFSGWDGKATEGLNRERRALAQLQHANIASLVDWGSTDDGIPWLCVEFVDGLPIDEYCRSENVSIAATLDLFEQVCGAVIYAHQRLIVHGDLKPPNILVRQDGAVKLLDFGISRLVDAAPATLTIDRRFTPAYASPEQLRGEPIRVTTDVYALGLLLYEMLTGARAFDGDTMHTVVKRVMEGEMKPPSQAPNLTPERRRAIRGDLDGIVMHAMETDGNRRYAAVEQLLADVRRHRQGYPVKARRPDAVYRIRKFVRRNQLAVAAAAVALLGIAAGAGLLLWKEREAQPERQVTERAVPLTTLPGEQNFPAFSPDGEKVAFSWVGPPRQDGQPAMNIYVKSILNGETVPVTSGPTEDRYPIWSPDGGEIAFERTTPAGLALTIVPSGGGAERKIADAGVGLAWSPDGQEIAYVNRYPPAGDGSILVRSLKTGAVRQLTSPEPRWERTATWSLDGQQIAFTRVMAGSVRELFVVPSQGGAARQITFDHQTIGGIAWTSDSRELVFDSSRNGGISLWSIPAKGGTPRQVTNTSNHPAFPAISVRGGRLAYSESFLDTNIWQFDRNGGAAAPFVPQPKCLICSSVEDDSPRFSPDGRKIVFVSRRFGSEELWTANSDGSSPVRLTFTGGPTGSPRWSPDGRSIAFDSRAAGGPDIFVVNAQGGAPRQLTAGDSIEIEPSWSHDGRWIYFVSDRGGRSHIWKAPSAGGEARQVTQGDGGECLESADGKRLYYFGRSDNNGVWSVPVEGGREEAIPELSRVRRTRAWTVRQEGIYFYDESTGRPLIRFFDFATRRVTTLLTLERPAPGGHPGLDISPDGRRLLYTQVDRRVDELMMIENFR